MFIAALVQKNMKGIKKNKGHKATTRSGRRGSGRAALSRRHLAISHDDTNGWNLRSCAAGSASRGQDQSGRRRGSTTQGRGSRRTAACCCCGVPINTGSHE